MKTMNAFLFLTILLSAPLTAMSANESQSSGRSHILIEAESFAKRGGWVVDPQFMDQMGSPYLLAHGLGRPVTDATTEIEVPIAGNYHVWVRTKDWVAQWQAPGAPGKFQVIVNGKVLEPIFGISGAQWHWQAGGAVELPAGHVAVALHDLTGFEGRCDAILFSRDEQLVPPNADPEMAMFRRKCLGLPEQPEAGGEFDFVVTGGGIAGTCAALSAARLGLKVALIQDRPVLGGNNSSEVRVWLQGARNKEPWPRIGDVVAELEQPRRAHYGPANTAELYEDEKKLAVVRGEPNICLFLEQRVNAAETDGGKIRAVIAQEINTGRRVRIAGRWFADCTGDAAVGALARADSELEPKGRMGPCNLWNVTPVQDAVSFPRCPWALDLSDKPFPGRHKTKPDPDKLGGWDWESGFDRDPMQEMEYVRDWNFRAMYGAWDALKNVDKVLPNYTLNWSAHILGKRESRRLLGDVVLCFDDLKKDRKFPDGCAPTGWSNDLHLPDPNYEKGFEGDAFISHALFGQFPACKERRPFWIPYRCLYSRSIGNLFMAGRDISTKHDALGAVRVMRTGGCMGEVVGMAASLCKKHNVVPRKIYERYLSELQELMRCGVGKKPGTNPDYDNGAEPKRKPVPKDQPVASAPAWLATVGPNLARAATVSVPGGLNTASAVALLNDGMAELTNNAGRWLSTGQPPHVVEFTWKEQVTLGAARIISGYFDGTVSSPIADFVFQWQDGKEWKELLGMAVRGNRDPSWNRTFPPVKTAKVRLMITRSKGDVSRIWEVELYSPPTPDSQRATKDQGKAK